MDRAVDAGAEEAIAAGARQQGFVALVLARLYGREDEDAAAGGHLRDALDHFLRGLRTGRHMAARAVLGPQGRVQGADVIVHFGDRADRGAGIAAGCFLLNGNGWRQPRDALDLGLLHLFEKLPRIRRQRLHVAPLPLGVQSVEGQRGFARARDAGDDR